MNFNDFKKTRAIIKLDALAGNYAILKKLHGDTRIAAVVKADAYGHGAVPVSKRLNAEGCDFFAVATIDEALELRENGISGTILVLGYVLDEFLGLAVENDISLAVDSCDKLKSILKAANGRKAKIHIKLDTGMNRTGFEVKNEAISKELEKAAEIIKSNQNIIVEGLFSHFAVSDEPDGQEFTSLQYKRFSETAKQLENIGINPQIKHICNSAGFTFYGEEMKMDAVRCGLALYGYMGEEIGLEPCMEFVTKIVNIHQMKKGESVSYGLKFTADRDMKIAVIGAGYADGFMRCLSCGKGYVLCKGKKAPVIGRVCMNMSMVDVSDIPEVSVGDDIVIFGKSGDAYLSADEVAKNAGTISYEIICAVSGRVPRVY